MHETRCDWNREIKKYLTVISWHLNTINKSKSKLHEDRHLCTCMIYFRKFVKLYYMNMEQNIYMEIPFWKFVLGKSCLFLQNSGKYWIKLYASIEMFSSIFHCDVVFAVHVHPEVL